MNLMKAYAQPVVRWTRIEMLLAAYDGLISLLEQVQGPLANDEMMKQHQLIVAQRLVLALYEGIDLRYGQIPENMKKLYVFVLHCIGMGPKLDVPAAIKVLRTIREGLLAIRDQANDLEQTGQITPSDDDVLTLKHLIA